MTLLADTEGKIEMKIRKIGVLLSIVASTLVSVASVTGATGTQVPAGTVINVIPVGVNPQAISSDGTDVWVANSGSNSVSEIQASTGTVVNTISVGIAPSGISSDGTDVWVAEGSGSVSEIQVSTGTVINTILGNYSNFGISSFGGEVWVTNNWVNEIQASTGTVVNWTTVGDSPNGISSDGIDVWVANRFSNSISEIAATGVPSPISAVTDVVTSDGNIANFSWAAPNFNGGKVITGYDVQTSTDGNDWTSISEPADTTTFSADMGSAAAYYFQVAPINAIGTGDYSSPILISRTSPNPPIDVTDMVARDGNTASFSWAAPTSDGGNAMTGYSVQTSTDGINWTTTPEPVGTTTFSTELNATATFYFQVAANNSFGTGQYSSVILIPRSRPSSPIGVADTVPGGGGTVNFSWSAPNFVGGSLITGYSVQTSRDGINWSTPIITTSTSYSTPARGPGSGLYFRVAANNALGVGTFSVPKLAVMPGLAPQNIKVLTATGQPVSGGAITWVASGLRSSHSYGLTASGQIQFPAAPAGNASVSLTSGVLPDGDYVSGTYPVILGLSGGATIMLPAEPSTGSTLVNVEAPGNLNLPGAVVTVPGVSQSSAVDGTTFTVPQVSNHGTTDVNGNFTVSGFIDPSSQVSISYDDGVVTQSTSVPFIQPLTTAVLTYDPVVSPNKSNLTTTVGSLVSVTLSASGNVGSNFAHELSKSRPNTFNPRTAVVGLEIKAVLPSTFKSCSAQRLSGTTNAQGQVTLKFCATATGVVRFKATGAYAAGAFTVYVKGTAPSAPLGTLASTPQLGHASLSWTAPRFNGGSPITKYVVTLSAAGKRTVVVDATSTHLNVGGLADATRYSVSIVAVNKTGKSPAATLKVSVA